MSSNLSNGDRRVTALRVEMREAVEQLGGPPSWSANRKRLFERAARAAGITPRMAKALFNWERDNFGSETIEAVREALRRRRRAREEAGREDARVAVARLVALRAALAAIDADFHRETIAQIDDALRGMGAALGT